MNPPPRILPVVTETRFLRNPGGLRFTRSLPTLPADTDAKATLLIIAVLLASG